MKIWICFVFILNILAGEAVISSLQAATNLASQDAPTTFISQMGKQAIQILSDPSRTRTQREEEFRKILYEFFDVPAIGQFVLGRYWRQLETPEKQESYLRLFESEIVRAYTIRFENYQGETFKVIKSTKEEDDQWSVLSEIVRPSGQKISVKWILYQTSSGLRVLDVFVGDISMSITKRSEYASIISREGGGVDGLLNKLRCQYQGAASGG